MSKTYILNEEGVALEVELEVEVEDLEGCEVFETEQELKQAHELFHKGSKFRQELVWIDENEIVHNFDGVLGTVDDDCSLEVYLSAFSY